MREKHADAYWRIEPGRCRKNAVTEREEARLAQHQGRRGSMPLRSRKPLLVPGFTTVMSQKDPGAHLPVEIEGSARDPTDGLVQKGEAGNVIPRIQRHGKGSMKTGPGPCTISTAQKIIGLQGPFVAECS